MGIVTNVEWECPKCGTKNIAQLSGWHYPKDEYADGRPEPIPRKAVPSNAELKWNPPCENCETYRLASPPAMLIELPIVPVCDDDSY